MQRQSLAAHLIPGNTVAKGDPSMLLATNYLDRMLDPLSRCFNGESAQRVAEYQIDPTGQATVDVLAEKGNEGLITPEEQAEYEAYINADDFIAILKLKARRYRDTNGTS